MFGKAFTFVILPVLTLGTGVAVFAFNNDSSRTNSYIPEVVVVIEYEEEIMYSHESYYNYALEIDEVPDFVEPDFVEPVDVIPEGLLCPDYYLLAKDVGWNESELERLDYVIWRESRCQTSAHNKYDPSSGSRGIIQINGFWCRPNEYTKNGFLQDHGVVNSCEDLFDPKINLQAGLAIYNYGVDKHGCGWGPWSTKRSAWCKS